MSTKRSNTILFSRFMIEIEPLEKPTSFEKIVLLKLKAALHNEFELVDSPEEKYSFGIRLAEREALNHE